VTTTVIDRLQTCSIDQRVIAITEVGRRFEGIVTGIDHTEPDDDDGESLLVQVVVDEAVVERHDLVRETVVLRAERGPDGTWSGVDVLAWTPETEPRDTGVDVQGGHWDPIGTVDQLFRI